jgi:hypothetical protein
MITLQNVLTYKDDKKSIYLGFAEKAYRADLEASQLEKDPSPRSTDTPLPNLGYALVTSFSTFMRVLTHIFLALIITSFILIKVFFFSRRYKAESSSMFNPSVFKTLLQQGFYNC